MQVRRRLGPWLALGGAGLAAGSVLLPWAASGGARRNGLDLAGVALDSGLVTSSWQRAALLALALAPMGFGLAWIAAALGRQALALAASAAVATGVAAGSVVVSGAEVVRPLVGARLGIIASGVTLTTVAGAAVFLARERRAGERGPPGRRLP